MRGRIRVRVIPLFLVGVVSVAVFSGCSQGRGSVVNTASVPAAAPAVSTPAVSVSASPLMPVVPTTGPNVLPRAQVPVLPAQAKVHDKAGALLFAENMGPALDWAYSTVNSAILRPLYASTCGGCKGSLAVFDAAHAAGEKWIGGHVTVTSATQMPHVPRGVTAEYAVQVTLRQAGLKLLSRNGKLIAEDAATHLTTIEYSLSWLTGRWMITDSFRLVKQK